MCVAAAGKQPVFSVQKKCPACTQTAIVFIAARKTPTTKTTELSPRWYAEFTAWRWRTKVHMKLPVYFLWKKLKNRPIKLPALYPSLPVFPHLPAWSTHMGYDCLWDFAVFCQLIRHVRLLSGFCSSGCDFAIPSSRLYLTIQTLRVAMGFVSSYTPCGLSPQTDGISVIQKRCKYKCYRLFKPATQCQGCLSTS